MEPRVFRYSRGRTWQQGVYAAALVGFIALAASRTFTSGKVGAGWFAVVVLLCLGIVAFRGIFDRRPALVISDEGVWFRGWNRAQPVLWSDVQDVRYVSAARGEPFITLEMRPEARHGTAAYQFRTGMLDVRNEDALAFVQECWRASLAAKARAAEA